MNQTKAATLTRCADLLREAVETRVLEGLDDRDAGYVEGWNAAASYFAAAFAAAAAEVQS